MMARAPAPCVSAMFLARTGDWLGRWGGSGLLTLREKFTAYRYQETDERYDQGPEHAAACEIITARRAAMVARFDAGVAARKQKAA